MNPNSHIVENRKCDRCGNIYSKTHQDHVKTFKNFNEDLCPTCSHNSQESKEKRRKTCLQKYGEESIAKVEDISRRKKETCLSLYGCSNPMQNSKISAKSQEALKNKYGENFRQDFYNKALHTLETKYNCNNPIHVPGAKEKVQATCLQKCGYTNYLSSPATQEKIAQTNMERYGCKNPLSSPEIRQKCNRTLLSDGGIKTSQQQRSLYQIVKELFPNMQIELNYSVNNYFLDVCIVPLKIDIEYDGKYWHNLHPEADEIRNNKLVELGYKIIRFVSTREIPKKEDILEAIKNTENIIIIDI